MEKKASRASRFGKSSLTADLSSNVIPEASSSVDDYMSDAILQTAVLAQGKSATVASCDRLTKKRQRPAEPVILSQKATSALVKERREEGLATAITSSNLGFRILQKLGWKEGVGLGKEGVGIVAPIDPVVKLSRGGIGRESKAEALRIAKKAEQERAATEAATRDVAQREGYRASRSKEFSQKKLLSDLGKARRTIAVLDESIGRPRTPFWLPELQPNTDEGEEVENTDSKDEDLLALWDEWGALDTSEQLLACLVYLRQCHKYCLYCGQAFEGNMDEQCPGIHAEDHDDE